MKKCLSLLLAALMLAAVLTGCGGNPSTEETDAPADTGTEQAAQTNWNVSSVTGTGTELKFRTGGDQGTYYGFGSVLATEPRSRPWSATAPRTTSSRCR